MSLFLVRLRVYEMVQIKILELLEIKYLRNDRKVGVDADVV